MDERQVTSVRKAKKKKLPPTIGWREWVGLPELGVTAIKAKMDTGARTSAIHAWNIAEFDNGDGPWVSFDLHPVQRNNQLVIACKAPLREVRDIRSSNGQVERRYIICTVLQLAENQYPIELSLTNRDAMGFRLLLGRAALRKRARIDPGRSFLIKRPAHFKT